MDYNIILWVIVIFEGICIFFLVDEVSVLKRLVGTGDGLRYLYNLLDNEKKDYYYRQTRNSRWNRY
jgi:hypothetical protein